MYLLALGSFNVRLWKYICSSRAAATLYPMRLVPCADPESFLQRGPTIFIVFSYFFSWLGERGSKYNYKGAIIGPSAKRHLNGISLAGRWWPNTECWLVSFIALWFYRVSGPIAKKPYNVCDFSGGRGPDHCSPPQDQRMGVHVVNTCITQCVRSLIIFERSGPAFCSIRDIKLWLFLK